MKRYLISFLSVALLAGLGMGCAVTRSVIDIPARPVTNPIGGRVVVITRVTDQRAFQLAPSDPSIPSLKDGAIQDKAITSRAVARKRGGFGAAMGDVLLPDGRNVETLVRESVTRALRESGYVVLEAGESAPADALPLEVDIRQFWSWFQPGFWAITLHFRAGLTLKGPVLKAGEQGSVQVELARKGMAATEGAWLETVKMGTDELTAKVKEALKAP
jgi:hypothetical protein